MVYVELPEVGATLDKEGAFGVVESVKAASDIYMPMAGEIVETNSALEDAPELINDDPYGQGWLIKFKASNPSEWDDLLSPEAYEETVAAGE